MYVTFTLCHSQRLWRGGRGTDYLGLVDRGGRAEGPRGPLLLVAGGNGPCKIVVSPRTVKERKVVIADPNDIHEYVYN